ncbi:MBL fold metallo-hydrolase [Engelhardtia mirabilis]|uniref:Putative quorum-quenching lactonase YtnP n=1 Tax=Engelhardtia mirabilis TaxID=2528011 RepID=A0A518BHU4_9BACT|nr:putative quorum-quenching lactonase YtnP [Planctomycetes bacterium Pla133]QDV00861.1 putative quorum-quenching lactonase YtnP [Planctomycetes bacterium Pla86]
MSVSVGAGAVAAGAGETRTVGGWTVTALSDGEFRLDGGAMWGVVPANLWRRMTPPADDNTIRMALRPFLARRGDAVVLIEGGVGDRWSDKLRGIYHLDGGGSLAASLRAAGVEPGEVTHVVASHCHWDHIGALVDADGAPLCPNARHVAPRIEVERCLKPDHVRRGSYRPEDLEPIVAAGLMDPFDGEVEPVPGLTVHALGGHSDGVSVVCLREPGRDLDRAGRDAAVFWSDVVPTTHHVQPPYIMAYDIDVERSFEQRSEWIARAAEAGWLGLFYHDDAQPFARIERGEKRFVATPA